MTPTSENTVVSLNRTYTLQDGKMNSITISESNIDNDIIITQNEQSIFIPKQYIDDITLIFRHIRENVL